MFQHFSEASILQNINKNKEPIYFLIVSLKKRVFL